MRTIIDLPDEQIRALDRVQKQQKLSRAAIIRAAVTAYLRDHGKADLSARAAFGLWKKAGAKKDGVSYQRAMRGEWER